MPPSYSPAAYVSPGSIVSQPNPYAMNRTSAVDEPATAPGRGFAYYLLLALVALALFTISMFGSSFRYLRSLAMYTSILRPLK